MAGSYEHIVTKNGNLVSNETFVQMIENLGDAYEAVEEMYGMIWYLADRVGVKPVKARVEDARRNYKTGLKIAKEDNQDQGRHDGG